MASKVFVKIPKFGLGNMMLVWAYGIAFAEKNQLPVTVSKWWGFRWGSLIRREKKNRLYLGYFKEDSLIRRIKIRIECVFKEKKFNPGLEQTSNVTDLDSIYIFNKLPPHNYFINLYPYLSTVKASLFKILSQNVLNELHQCKKPDIGIHIRRGDFKVGNHLTPVSYFVDLIKLIRGCCGEHLEVTVFTDAEDGEITEIMNLPNVEQARNKYDVVDMLQLSQSKFLILSRDSSFSYWAAFLSEGFVIMTSEDWQRQIKPNFEQYFEFRLRAAEVDSKEELIKTIKKRINHV